MHMMISDILCDRDLGCMYCTLPGWSPPATVNEIRMLASYTVELAFQDLLSGAVTLFKSMERSVFVDIFNTVV
jgi:hypothetical protein